MAQRAAVAVAAAMAGLVAGCGSGSSGSSTGATGSTFSTLTGSGGSSGQAHSSTSGSSGSLSTAASTSSSGASTGHHNGASSGATNSSTSSGTAASTSSSAAATSSGGGSGMVGGIPGGIVGEGTQIAGCSIFPNDNPWNVEVDGPDIQVLTSYSGIPQGTALHADFGDFSTDGYGIPFSVVDGGQPDVDIDFDLYASESDPGPGGWIGTNPVTANADMGETAWPFFLGMPIEGNPSAGGQAGNLPGDQHGIVVQQGGAGCVSYEAWNCVVSASLPFNCANGAVFDLTSNALRPAGWTSGDLAGMSILAGLVRLAEVQAGTVTHAVRVTFNNTQSGYIPPATHAVSPGSGNASGGVGSAYPPMGLRLRLKASTDLSSYHPESQVIMAAMKKYGLLVADIGSDWYFQGDSNDGWNDMASDGQDTLIDEISGDFHGLHGSDFEVVYSGDPTDADL